MKRIIGLVGIAAVLFFAGQVLAQSGSSGGDSAAGTVVPRLVRFSGVLREAGERPARGAVEMSFSLFQEESGGEPLWFETQTVEVDAQGRYNVLLGAMHAGGLPMDLFTSGEARWLEVMVGKSAQPRVLLVSVPYALKAGDAATLGGKPASAYALQGQTTTAVVVAGTASSGETTQASLTQPGTQPALVTTGQTHFTDTTADYVVRITQNGAGRGLSSLSQSGEAVYGQIVGAAGTTYGVRGITPSTTGAGVFGSNTATTGAAYGVRGNSSSTGGAGVAGFNTATTGSAFGIIGQTSSTAGVALYGRALAATGATVGLQGVSDSTSGFGINALASANSGATTGLLARANSASGTAAVLYNEGGGKILSGRTTGSVEKFSVDGNGNVSGNQFLSSVATGTAPLTVASTTLVTNLNADRVDGFHAGAFAKVGPNIFTGSQVINAPGTALSAHGTGANSIGVLGTSDDGPTGTGSAGYFLNSSGGKILVADDGSSTVLRVDTYGLRLERPIVNNISNSSTTGTVLNKLAKFNPDGTVSVTSAGDVGGAIGVVVSGAGTSGDANVAYMGLAPCVFDNTAVVADYVTISPTADGQCHDAGPDFPSGVQVLGRVVESSNVPPLVYLFGTEVRGLGPDRLQIAAMAFNFPQGSGSAFVFSQGNYSPSSGSTADCGGFSGNDCEKGAANVSLPQGTVVTGFQVCGQDNDTDHELAGYLYAKPQNDTFGAPTLMASVHSGIASASAGTQCLLTNSISSATINNTANAYYVELDVGALTSAIGVQIIH